MGKNCINGPKWSFFLHQNQNQKLPIKMMRITGPSWGPDFIFITDLPSELTKKYSLLNPPVILHRMTEVSSASSAVIDITCTNANKTMQRQQMRKLFSSFQISIHVSDECLYIVFDHLLMEPLSKGTLQLLWQELLCMQGTSLVLQLAVTKDLVVLHYVKPT